MDAWRFPKIVGGVAVDGDPAELIHLDYEVGIRISMPPLTTEDVRTAADTDDALTHELVSMTTAQVLDFLAAVGERLSRPDHPARDWIEHISAPLLGCNPRMLAVDYETIESFLTWREAAIFLETDLGDAAILDEWCSVGESLQRAYPIGLAVHLMVGNLPLASAFTMIRGLITRNRNLAKLPSRDPVFPLMLGLTMIEVDPSHPLTRATTMGYWARDSEAMREALKAADLICAWGGADAMELVHSLAIPPTRIQEFGPKRSCSLVVLEGLSEVEVWAAARRVVMDSFFYEQEACFNAQRVFVVGDCAAFIPHLERAVAEFEDKMACGDRNRDIAAHVSMTRLDATYRGTMVSAGPSSTILREFEDWRRFDHPLARTLVLQSIAEPIALLEYIDSDVQTVGVYPWSASVAVRDQLGELGASRIIEAGMARYWRFGFSHDGGRPMRDFVRFAGHEKPSYDDFGFEPTEPLERWVFDW